MTSLTKTSYIPDAVVMNKIYMIRGQKVMLDRDLADLYGTETRALKQAVRRNPGRFPADFMFQLTKNEFEAWRSQNVISKADQKGWRYAPMAFTEHGVLMLSSVLKSKRAIEMNIQIMRIFTRMREMILTHKDFLLRIEQIERRVTDHDERMKLLFDYLKKFAVDQQKPRRSIGFKSARKDTES